MPIKINGATSGSTTIAAPDSGGDETIVLSTALASKVDYATPTNAQSGTGASAYTFVLADASRLTTATGTSAKTFTIPPQSSVTWIANSIIRVANYGAGDLTIAGGSGVTVTNAAKTLAQYESAALVRTGSNAWTLIPFSGGAGNADFSNAATGTYTGFKWVRFTGNGTLTVTKSGLIDVLVVGGGGLAQSGIGNQAGGGGGGGGIIDQQMYLAIGSYSVYVGGAGSSSGYSRGLAALNGGQGSQNAVGVAGGNGGGGSGWAGGQAGGAGLIGGNAGGTGVNGAAAGGGGGGDGAGGLGTGGAGYLSSITGSSVRYAAGGNGSPGNGNNATSGGTGWVASANTGHGAPGIWASNAPSASAQSGVVIFRVAV